MLHRLLLSLTLALTPLLLSCSPKTPTTKTLTGQTMGTNWSVKLITEQLPLGLRTEIQKTLNSVNAVMSSYQPNSSLSSFNTNTSTNWQSVPAELAHIVTISQKISEQSNGAFDITIAPLVDLWGFGSANTPITHIPSDDKITQTLERVGYYKLEARITPPALRKSISNLNIDLSAIAKGYGVDRIAETLDQHSFENYLIEIGGELRAKGNNSKGKPWRIAIERPDSHGKTAHQIIPLINASMATSGDYRNFFVDGGKRYSHTIDVESGKPITHSLASVTVIATSCMQADGLATALTAMGLEAGLALAESKNIPALFIERTDSGFHQSATTQLQKILMKESQ